MTQETLWKYVLNYVGRSHRHKAVHFIISNDPGNDTRHLLCRRRQLRLIHYRVVIYLDVLQGVYQYDVTQLQLLALCDQSHDAADCSVHLYRSEHDSPTNEGIYSFSSMIYWLMYKTHPFLYGLLAPPLRTDVFIRTELTAYRLLCFSIYILYFKWCTRPSVRPSRAPGFLEIEKPSELII